MAQNPFFIAAVGVDDYDYDYETTNFRYVFHVNVNESIHNLAIL